MGVTNIGNYPPGPCLFSPETHSCAPEQRRAGIVNELGGWPEIKAGMLS